MSNSSLVTKKWWANPTNYTKGRNGYKIRGIVIHHAASTSLNSIGTVFSQKGRNGSAHYGVGGKQIHQYVDEANAAWHCSNWYGNMGTVGIETTNSTGAPNWKVSDETFNTLCKLVADIAKRNGLGKLKFEPNATWPLLSAHKDWRGAQTACPGPYLYKLMNKIAEKANAINYPPKPTPTKPTLTWTKFNKVKKYKTNLQPTNLWNFNCTTFSAAKSVKQYKKGETIDIYGQVFNKQLNSTYLLTEYSFTKKITNGFNVKDMVEITTATPPPAPSTPAKPKIEWKDIPNKPLGLFTKTGAKLVDLDTGKVVQSYSANTKINLAQEATYNGKKYYRTQYSQEKGFNWAFEASMFEEPIVAPEPAPSAPTTDPPINSTPGGTQTPEENKNNDGQDEDSKDGEGTSSNDKNFVLGVLNKILEFIKKVISLITSKGE